MLNIIFASLLFGLNTIAPVQQVRATIEIHVPKGMPIKLRPSADRANPQVSKYIIKRVVNEDARGATFIVAMIDKNNNILPGTRNKFTTSNLSDPMTIATSDPRVAKIVIIVESLETSTGRWVPGNRNQAISIDDVLLRRRNALPSAKEVLAKH